RYGRDSLCHLIVQGRIAEADRRVMGEEMRLMKESKPHVDLGNLDASDAKFVKKVVQMITDDLAFAEDDSYTIRQFLRRLVKNKPFYRILFDLFALLTAGVVDGLCQVYLKELDLSGTAIIGHKILAKVGAVVGIIFIRKITELPLDPGALRL
ncbi:hypothetical protein PMAYCL1PPCAC_13338, partial [Pristionchus mayeri]